MGPGTPRRRKKAGLRAQVHFFTGRCEILVAYTLTSMDPGPGTRMLRSLSDSVCPTRPLGRARGLSFLAGV